MYVLAVDRRTPRVACIGDMRIADGCTHHVPHTFGRASACRRFVGDSRPEF